jgi:hypothetical protein
MNTLTTEYVPFLDEVLANNLDETTLPSVQVHTAERLASAFGHEWGGYKIPRDHTGNTAQAVTLGDIYRTTRCEHQISEGWQRGIEYPHVDESGAIVHMTMTGRTQWEVAPNGSVVVAICRPDGVCLTAHFDGVYGAGNLTVERGTVPFGTRHLDALHKALSAICKRWQVLYAIDLAREWGIEFPPRRTAENTDSPRAIHTDRRVFSDDDLLDISFNEE